MKVALLIVLLLLVCVISVAQDTVPEFAVGPTERMKLESVSKDISIFSERAERFRLEMVLALRDRSDAVTRIYALGDEIKKAHEWGDDVVFDPDKLSFAKKKE